MNEKCVLTIGKFEGIHQGHRLLIASAKSRAENLGLPPVVAVFDPHPYKLLVDPSYKPLYTPEERDYLLSKAINKIHTFNFTQEFANMSPQDFCNEIFITCNAQEVVVGENFRFGKNRQGTVETLKEEAAKHGKTVDILPIQKMYQTPTSTSLIRELLTQNNFQEAASHLHCGFSVSGVVTKGRQMGRLMGFPTLNIYPPQDKFLPKNGVYQTITYIGGNQYPSLTNIGIRPTVSDQTGIAVETHIPTLPPAEIYGTHIIVELINFVREERKFTTIEELKQQIQADLQASKEFLQWQTS